MSDALPGTAAVLGRGRAEGAIVHGFQLSVSLRGELVADIASGVARPGVPMTTGTISRQHCAAAPLIALAVAQLVSACALGLDQPLHRFIPQLKSGGKDRLTLRHVLTHTAGLHASDEAAKVLRSDDDIVEAIGKEPLPDGWVVGAKAAFSSFSGWQVVGMVVEKVAGRPLREHLREALFLPLDMADTWVGMSADDYERIDERLGVLYIQEEFPGSGPVPLEPMWHDLTPETCMVAAPSGGYGSARDLRRFYEVMLDHDQLADLTAVEPQILEQLVSPQRSGMYDSGLQRVCDYGLGFMVNLPGHQFGGACSTRSYGHSGLQGASVAFADEANQLVVVVVPNDILVWRKSAERRQAIVDAVYDDLAIR